MGRVQVQGFKCERCGHVWAPRQALDNGKPVRLPKVCPKCKSAWWDVPKKKKPGSVERKSLKRDANGGG
jgi:predicted Zn-ribbon and HTH transcriptional regulator